MQRTALLWAICWLGTAAAADVALAEAPADAETALHDLHWLAGCWAGTEATGATLECWTAPEGGMMLGWNRVVRTGGKASFEYLRIATTGDGVVYFASPGGREATPFRLAEVSGRSAVFENPDHDFPQRIFYRLAASGELEVRIEGDVDGTVRKLEWSWRATDFPGRKHPGRKHPGRKHPGRKQ